MESIANKIKQSKRISVLFFDLNLISLLGLVSFFAFEKRWPGLISYYLHPAILIVFWLITIYLISMVEIRKKDWLQILAGILLIILILTFYLNSLGPWAWMILFIIPAAALIWRDKKKA